MHVASFLFSNYYIINLIATLYHLNFLQFALETQPQDDGKTNRYFTFYFFNKKFGTFLWNFSLNNYMLLSHTHVHCKFSFFWFIQHFICFCCCFACCKYFVFQILYHWLNNTFVLFKLMWFTFENDSHKHHHHLSLVSSFEPT